MFEKGVKGMEEDMRHGGRSCTGAESHANGDGGVGGGGGGSGCDEDRKQQGCGREEMAGDARSGGGHVVMLIGLMVGVGVRVRVLARVRLHPFIVRGLAKRGFGRREGF